MDFCDTEDSSIKENRKRRKTQEENKYQPKSQDDSKRTLRVRNKMLIN